MHRGTKDGADQALDEAATRTKLVTFVIGGRVFAAPIEQVRETVELRPITPVFRMPTVVSGITNLRGEILAVLDVGVLLGFPPNRRDPSARLVVVDAAERSAALLVDTLGPIRSIPRGALAPIPSTMAADQAALLVGVVSLPEHPLPILDLERVLGAPVLRAYAEDDPADARA